VATQIRFCRLIDTLACAISLGSNQYCIIEHNIFLGCKFGLILDATYGSPQGYTIRKNTFNGLRTERDCDIYIRMTDINSRGHNISENIFGDGLPNHASGSQKRFIADSAPTTAVATGMIVKNEFHETGSLTYGATGTACLISTGWIFSNNYDEDGLIART